MTDTIGLLHPGEMGTTVGAAALLIAIRTLAINEGVDAAHPPTVEEAAARVLAGADSRKITAAR